MKSDGQILTLPGAIIVAGALVAIAIIWTQKPATTGNPPSSAQALQNQLPQVSMSPVSAADHILGNPDASVKIVEYSDPSCPYCQLFNPTMEQLIADYGPGGQVAWVYRQFPLDKPDANGDILHPNSGRQAEAMECAAGVGGNAAFWRYEKAWFDAFPQNGADESGAADDAQIAAAAKSAGLDAISFNDCLTSGRFKDKVAAEYTDGVNTGVDGTPYVVIVTPSGTKIPLAGAQSYSTLKNTIDALLAGNQPAQTEVGPQ